MTVKNVKQWPVSKVLKLNEEPVSDNSVSLRFGQEMDGEATRGNRDPKA